MASSSSYHHNCSKSQMCLFKILHIISSNPPAAASKQEPFPSNNKGVGIDLNLRFSSIEGSVESESSAEIPNNSEGEVEVEEGVEEKRDEVENNNEVDHVETTSFGRNKSSSNCLDLLIEAARVISEKNESKSESAGELRTRGVKKRKERWVVVDLYDDDVAEEREPVVRSKRGRNQALPYRFRDSVIEPLKHSARSQRISSSSSSTLKRLPR